VYAQFENLKEFENCYRKILELNPQDERAKEFFGI